MAEEELKVENSYVDPEGLLRTSNRMQQPRNMHVSTVQHINREQRNNFPPYFSRCPQPCGPCLYHNIAVEIPLPYKWLIRFGLALWIANSLVWFFRIFAYMDIFIARTGKLAFGLSFAWFFVFTPLSFLGWYWPLYVSFRDNQNKIHFIRFCVGLLVQIAVNIFISTGFGKVSLGYKHGVTQLGMNGLGVLIIANAVLLDIAALCEVILLITSIVYKVAHRPGYDVESFERY